ncbi:hypothetical protein F6X40_24215 [Paraburkholderia sp. UCT31]|uniref:effector-associated constant component EACC1 n=1 Tax=Paraburkholderia sp. UCT31 TaxID=2615209 RepID=UPI0016553EB9|nr:hypothetical protein [Paraburkholderia sp. UCT31]MBC8739822.1 hypothetical protein [Paraburkholderia sp. UCT31]
MEIPTIELSVVASTQAQSGKLANELRMWLDKYDNNFAHTLRRGDPSNQDLGSILAIVGSVAAPVVSAFFEEAARELARTIADWMRKRKVSLTVDAGGGVKVENADPETVERIVCEILKRQHEAAISSKNCADGDG